MLFLLETACVNSMGETTGFADAVFGEFRELFLGNVIKNIAELDWRISRKHSDSDLLDETWGHLTPEFGNANAVDRRAVLDAVGSIVAFQPLPVLELVRQAIDTEAETAKVYSFLVEQGDVLKEVPELLGWIAFAPGATTEAVKRLWRLAKNGGRAGEQAQGVLKRLVAFRRNKNVEFNEKMMGLVEELAAAPDAFAGSFTPLDLVDEVLDREVDFTEMSGRAITFGALPLNYPVVRGVRERALGLLEKLLGSANPRAAIRATRSLGLILSGFLTKMGRALSESEVTWQNGERIRVVLSSNEDSILAWLAMQVLLELREVDRQSYAAFGKEMAGHKRALVAESVAHAVCYGPNLSAPITEDVQILIELARRSERPVLEPTFFGLARLGRIPGVGPIVCKLAARVPLNEDPKLAEATVPVFLRL